MEAPPPCAAVSPVPEDCASELETLLVLMQPARKPGGHKSPVPLLPGWSSRSSCELFELSPIPVLIGQ